MVTEQLDGIKELSVNILYHITIQGYGSMNDLYRAINKKNLCS